MSFGNGPIVPILFGFREQVGAGLHESSLIPPCLVADKALTSPWHRRSQKAHTACAGTRPARPGSATMSSCERAMPTNPATHML